jgi:DNA-binding HxlR family transcriptional regulator
MVHSMKRLPELPAERTLKVISGRWKAVILYHLFDGPKRLSELKRLAPNASQKVLIQQLREMEAHGLIDREIFRQVPPRVDYTATKLGLSLEPVVMSLCDWGRRHAAHLNELDRVTECVRGGPARRVISSSHAVPEQLGTAGLKQQSNPRVTGSRVRSSFTSRGKTAPR